jgi:hypothetical protein
MIKNTELLRQVKAYGLTSKLQDLAREDEKQRPFRHLPKQFSRGILIGNIAIVPRRVDETRFAYVIADMIEAKLLYENICLKQSAILIAHYLADNKRVPENILQLDLEFASKLFEIKQFKTQWKRHEKQGNEAQSFIYENKYVETSRHADEIKQQIHNHFASTFKSSIV